MMIDFEIGWSTLKNEGIYNVLDKLHIHSSSRVENDIALYYNQKDKLNDKLLEKKKAMELYTITYQMCTQAPPYNWSGKLYYAILGELEDICKNRIEPFLQHFEKKELLQALILEWYRMHKLLKSLKTVVGYLDRFYVQRLALDSLKGLGIKAFKELVFMPNKNRLTKAFLNLVEQDRTWKRRSSEERQSVHKILKDTTNIYVSIGGQSNSVYRKELETYLLEETKIFMRNQANRWLTESTCTQYLYKVKAQLTAETSRVDQYLYFETKETLLKVCEFELIGEQLESFLDKPDSGCRWLLENEKNDVLNLLFVLLRRVPNGLSPMSEIFKSYLKQIGSNLLADPGYENQWKNKLDNTLIANLVHLNQRFRKLISSAFSEHSIFHRSLKEAFEFFMNLPLNPYDPGKDLPKREVTISELLSDNIDRRLRKSTKDMVPKSPLIDDGTNDYFLTPRSETTLERELALTCELFGFISDKDIFAQFYRNHLAKRLILNRSQSLDAEQLVISHFQSICGNPYVSKFTGMMKDLNRSKGLQTDFLEFLKNENKNETKQSVVIQDVNDTPRDNIDEIEQKPSNEVKDDLIDDNSCNDFLKVNSTKEESKQLAKQNFDTVEYFGFDVNTQVLTSGFWPSYNKDPILNLPKMLGLAKGCFENFYASRTAERRLTWIHNLSKLDISCIFENGNKIIITLNTIQGCILLLYNQALSEKFNDKKYTLQEMSNAIGISIKTVTNQLRSLVKGKFKLIKEVEKDKNNAIESKYALNLNFETKLKRVRILMLPSEKAAISQEDRTENLIKVSQERRYAIEAAICRIMKNYTTLSYQELECKVIEKLKPVFTAHPKVIKQRLEDLLQRDYLEYGNNDEEIVYVA